MRPVVVPAEQKQSVEDMKWKDHSANSKKQVLHKHLVAHFLRVSSAGHRQLTADPKTAAAYVEITDKNVITSFDVKGT